MKPIEEVLRLWAEVQPEVPQGQSHPAHGPDPNRPCRRPDQGDVSVRGVSKVPMTQEGLTLMGDVADSRGLAKSRDTMAPLDSVNGGEGCSWEAYQK
jgi:hypothetical protein